MPRYLCSVSFGSGWCWGWQCGWCWGWQCGWCWGWQCGWCWGRQCGWCWGWQCGWCWGWQCGHRSWGPQEDKISRFGLGVLFLCLWPSRHQELLDLRLRPFFSFFLLKKIFFTDLGISYISSTEVGETELQMLKIQYAHISEVDHAYLMCVSLLTHSAGTKRMSAVVHTLSLSISSYDVQGAGPWDYAAACLVN